MKHLYILFCLSICNISLILAQENPEVSEYCFVVGQTGISSNVTITHTFTATGTAWEYDNENDTWPIYQGSDWLTAGISLTGSTTSEPAYSGSGKWGGITLGWLNCGLEICDKIALGLYKITNSNNSAYFYIDFRDRRFSGPTSHITNPYNPDFYIKFASGVYYYKSATSNLWVQISTGQLINVWDIKEQGAPDTDFQNFWSHALNLTNNGSDNPRIVWGNYPSSCDSYKVYYRFNQNGSYSLLSTVSSGTYSFVHEDLLLGQGYIAEYYVKPFYNNQLLSSTNTLNVSTSGFYKQRPKLGSEEITYNLLQNFPNPFNPLTIISFKLGKKSNTKLEIYDVMGNLVKELLNEEKEPGTYNVEFDASLLSSGVYFYTLKADGISQTRKMSFIK